MQPKTNRRNFLIGATLGSAGAVAAVVASGPGSDAVQALADVAEKPQTGYHETDHIRQYYQTTRI